VQGNIISLLFLFQIAEYMLKTFGTAYAYAIIYMPLPGNGSHDYRCCLAIAVSSFGCYSSRSLGSAPMYKVHVQNRLYSASVWERDPLRAYTVKPILLLVKEETPFLKHINV
jgi:hypothetical protein